MSEDKILLRSALPPAEISGEYAPREASAAAGRPGGVLVAPPPRPSWLRGVLAWAALLRPLNVVLFAAGVGVGGVLVAEAAVLRDPLAARLVLAALSAMLIGGAANAINDVFDLEIDRVNRPGRPLPSGRVSVRAAKTAWWVGTAGGLAAGLALSAVHFAVAAVVAAALFVYNARLKRTVLVGNVLVAGVVGLALVYGAAAVGAPGPALVGAAFAFLTTLAREVIKDVEDVAGDAAAGARTLPVVFGRAAALRTAFVVVAVTVALTPAPFLWLGYSSLYLLVVLGAAASMLRVLWLLHAPASEAEVHRAGSLMKWAMAAGLAALACAGLPD